MGSVNKVVLVGNLGRDSELRYTPGGAAVLGFSLATTETWNDKQGVKQERVEWHKINLWGKSAESLNEYLKKGKQVYVEGRIESRKWEKDGQERTSTEIRADRVVLLGGGTGGGQNRTTHTAGDVPAERPASGETVGPDEADDIPF